MGVELLEIGGDSGIDVFEQLLEPWCGVASVSSVHCSELAAVDCDQLATEEVELFNKRVEKAHGIVSGDIIIECIR